MSLSKISHSDSISSLNSINKVKSLPVVESTCFWLSENYKRLKERNFVTKQTCTIAESTLKNSFDCLASIPLLNKFKPQVDMLDSLACNQLDKLEHAFPILKSDTDTLVNQGKELLNTWTVQPTKNKLNNIKSCTETIYQKSCEYSNLKEQTRLLANKILELTESLIEKQFILDLLKKSDEENLVQVQNEYLKWYLNQYKQNSITNNHETHHPISHNTEMSLCERTKTLSLVFYFFMQEKLCRQLNDSISNIKSQFAQLSKLIEIYDVLKRSVSFRLQDQFHLTKDKLDIYKEYLDVLSKQFIVQDGRSLEHVHVSLCQ
jgi:hypothetical protein